MNKDFPAGYQVHISSWENDLDFQETTIFSGLTSEDVKLLLYIARKFRSKDSPAHGGYGIGNGQVWKSQMLSIILEAFEKFPAASPIAYSNFYVSQDCDFPLDYADEVICSILGYPKDEYHRSLDDGEDVTFVRVFDKAEVYFLDAPAPNVTKEFE